MSSVKEIVDVVSFRSRAAIVPAEPGSLSIQVVANVAYIVDDQGNATPLAAGGSSGLGKLIAAEFIATSDPAAVPLSCVVPGLLIGATPKAIVDMTAVLTSAQVAAFFESACTVAGHFQQTGAFPGGDVSVLGIFANP